MNVQEFNAPLLYLIVGASIAVIVAMCLMFLVKSWRAGVQLGMDKAVLKKAVVSSCTFSLLPGVSILLGVVALSGTLGVPLPWLRLSVIGNLQYEVNVAQIAATGIGLSGLKLSEMTAEAFVTICLVMTCGILGGAFMSLFTLKLYTKKLKGKPKQGDAQEQPSNPDTSANATPDLACADATANANAEPSPTAAKTTPTAKKMNFGDWAMIAMFVGMCAAYIGSYIGQAAQSTFLPLLTAIAAAACMALCEVLERKLAWRWLENFDLAASMLVAMAFAVCINPFL